MPNTGKRKPTREAVLTGRLIPEVFTIHNFLSGFHFANLDHTDVGVLLRDELASPGQKDTALCLNMRGSNTKARIAALGSSGSPALRKHWWK